MNKEPKKLKGQDGTKTEPKKKAFNIPLPIVPNDESTVDEEMNELFNEDKVKHKHGGAEPERD